MPDQYSVADFAARVKAKYPEYRDVADDQLVSAVLAKYPEYRPIVTTEKQIDYPAIEKKAPSLMSDPKGWWQSKSDAEKQEILDTLGEFAGGTVGALAGGTTPLAIAGAGAGAVAGKNIARLAGQAAGIEQAPETARSAAKEQAVTFAAGAGGEGIGRAIPLAARAAKAAVIKRGLKPDPEIARLAREQGVTPTAPMISEPLGWLESSLEKFPTSRGVIKEAKMKAQLPWELNLQKLAAQYVPGPPQSNLEIGEALRSGLTANREAMSRYFAPRYTALVKRAGDVPIDLTPLQQSGAALLESLPEEATRFFPGGAFGKIQQIAGLQSKLGREFTQAADDVAQQFAGKPYGQLAPEEQVRVNDVLKKIGISDEPGPPSMTFAEAQKLRTQLLEAERLLTKNSPSLDRSAIPLFRKRLDQSIEEALGSANPEALTEWRTLNQQYRETTRKLNPPKRPGGQGNVMAGVIERESAPERLVDKLTASPTPFGEAVSATSPKSLTSLPEMPPLETPDPIPMVRRRYAEDLIEKSRVNQPLLNDERLVAPRTLERKLAQEQPQTVETVLGPEAYQKFREAAQVGKVINPRDLNPSNTSAATEMINAAKRATAAAAGVAGLGGYVYGGEDVPYYERLQRAAAVGAGIYAPRAVAKKLVNPALAGQLLNPQTGAGGPMAGAISRLVLQQTMAPPPPPEMTEEELRRRRLYGPIPPEPLP